MTHPDHERNEGDLRALFDATADKPDGVQLTKLRARAVDVPQLKRRPRWLVWAPFMAVAVGALTVVLVRGGQKEGETARGTATTPTAREAPEPSVVARAPAPTPSEERIPTEEPPPTPDESGATADLDYSEDGFGIDDLSGPLDDVDDAELDGWLAATDSFLEDG